MYIQRRFIKKTKRVRTLILHKLRESVMEMRVNMLLPSLDSSRRKPRATRDSTRVAHSIAAAQWDQYPAGEYKPHNPPASVGHLQSCVSSRVRRAFFLQCHPAARWFQIFGQGAADRIEDFSLDRRLATDTVILAFATL